MTELIKSNQNQLSNQRMEWTPEQVQLIKDTVCKGATDDELKLFLYVAQKTGLDPLTKQIYSVARWDSRLGREVRTNQTGIDGYRVVAERSSKYAGQMGPYWCGEDGEWKEIWLKNEPPIAAKVGIIRTDFKEVLWSVALFKNYCPMIKNKQTGKYEPSQFWAKMPDLMIAKVAEALALRKTFPQDLSGVTTKEEMDQDEGQEILDDVKKIESDMDAKREKRKKDLEKMKEEKVVEGEVVKENKGDSFSTFEKTPENLVKAITNICSVVCKNMNKTEKLKFIKDELKVKDFRELSTMDIFSLDDIFQALCSKYENELK